MNKDSTDLVAFDQLKSDIVSLVAPTMKITVTDFTSAQSAIDTVKQIKDYIKKVDAVRTGLVGPLNDRVRVVNNYAKGIGQPLLDAEAYIKRQLVVFEEEQERVRLELMKKAEEERLRIEAELAAKHEAELAEAQEGVALEQEAASMFGSEAVPEESQAEAQVVAIKQKASEEMALAKGDFREKQWDINQQGIKNTKKVWKCELVDINVVPVEYLIRELNEQAILAMARAGVTNIPGVRVWQETAIAIGRSTYVPRITLKQESK